MTDIHITPTLLQYYNTPEMVDKLIHLGDISCIYANIAPPKGVQHTFDNPPLPDTTVAYFRDRNEPWKDNKPKYGSRTGFMNIDDGYKYLYDTKNQEWRIQKGKICRRVRKKDPVFACYGIWDIQNYQGETSNTCGL